MGTAKGTDEFSKKLCAKRKGNSSEEAEYEVPKYLPERTTFGAQLPSRLT